MRGPSHIRAGEQGGEGAGARVVLLARAGADDELDDGVEEAPVHDDPGHQRVEVGAGVGGLGVAPHCYPYGYQW